MDDDHHRKSIELSDAILRLKTKNEVDSFLTDLCLHTRSEPLKKGGKFVNYWQLKNYLTEIFIK